VPLDADTTLWLFGDTFVNPLVPVSDPLTRQGAKMVHNSIAIATCTDAGAWSFDYAWGKGESGEPQAFLDPGMAGHYWWLFDGFVHGDALYLGLLGVEESEPHGPLNMPFRFSGVELARIRDFQREPTQWSIEILPLSSSSEAFPTSTLVVEGDYLYLFAFLETEQDEHPQILSRLPLSALSNARPGERLEYLSRSGAWRPGLDPLDARRLMDDSAAEMTVRHHPELDRWLAIYNYPTTSHSSGATAPSDAVHLRAAPELAGPWSEPVVVFRIPELADSLRDPNTACYAAKEHPQLAGEGRLLITYVCNLFTKAGEDPFEIISRLFEQMNLYRPVAVSLPLPELPE
jgi:hypothetical protein